MSGAFVAIGPIRYLDEMRLVALTIEEAGSIERSAILKKFDRVIDVYVLEQIERTLLARGEIDAFNSAGDRTYTWTGGSDDSD
jgi:hypothetical protein